MLSTEQKREFKRNGFLVLHDDVNPGLVGEVREAVWRSIPEERDDPAAWEPGEYRNVVEELDGLEPFERLERYVYGYATELIGDDIESAVDGRMQVQLKFPQGASVVDPEAPQPGELTGHVDGFGQYTETGDIGYTTMAAVVYLDRVQPRGGGFTVWPGSHRLNERLFREHSPELVGERGSKPPAPTADGGWDMDRNLTDRYDPFEIHGGQGTLVLWHGKLVHSGGVNAGPNVRMAAIPRFTRANGEEIKMDAATDIWKYWDGMTGVSLGELA